MNESFHYTPPKPILNGCYADKRTGMVKVRMLCYSGNQISEILLEDIRGRYHRLALADWNDRGPIPCCYAGPARRLG